MNTELWAILGQLMAMARSPDFWCANQSAFKQHVTTMLHNSHVIFVLANAPHTCPVARQHDAPDNASQEVR